MPELPEVETARRQLERWAADRTIRRVRVLDPTTVRPSLSSRPTTWPDGAARVAALSGPASRPLRHGKRLGWVIGDTGLLIHLGMTGSWVRQIDPPPHARLGFEADAWFWFVDPRRFGCVVPVAGDALGAHLSEGLGPDALCAPLDAAGLAAAFGRRGPIKPALLDQARLAGLGNIHATEALWTARIAPHRSGATLSAASWDALARAIPAQLEGAIEDTDALVYVNLGGDNPFRVYGREGAPCPRCKAPIIRTILGGRATFLCPTCQSA